MDGKINFPTAGHWHAQTKYFCAGGIREGREEKVGRDKFTLQSLVFLIYKRGLQGGSQE